MFTPFPKIPRLSREVIVTEKIDGTNASIWIDDIGDDLTPEHRAQCVFADHAADGRPYWVWAASRSRFITPGKATDNFGFAGWVQDNAEELVKLGPGVHHGEWWGGKIQRGYGLSEKRFSLFNTDRWSDQNAIAENIPGDAPVGNPDTEWAPECCRVVPILWRGPFDAVDYKGGTGVGEALAVLRNFGSVAAVGFMNPEGVVIYHTGGGAMFKKTFEGDEEGKGV